METQFDIDEEKDIQQAWKEAWSLNPDKDKQPPGLKLIAIMRKNGTEYLLYKQNVENGEKYWYDSRREQKSPEVGWGRR